MRTKLRLTLDVEYEPKGVSTEELTEMLREIASNAAGNGLMTGDTSAEVATWHASVGAPPGEHGNLNGIRVIRVGSSIHIPLPREAWREIEGGCACVYCSADGHPAPAFWDTLALAFTKEAKGHGPDTTWTCHGPEYQPGARKKRQG